MAVYLGNIPVSSTIDMNKATLDTISSFQNDLAGVTDKITKATTTSNGWNIKFDNGFMIQGKVVTAVPSGVIQEGSYYLGDLNIGNWDVPFTRFLYSTASIAGVAGARNYWIGGYSYDATNGVRQATATFAGIRKIGLGWNGFTNTVTVMAVGYGFWK